MRAAGVVHLVRMFCDHVIVEVGDGESWFGAEVASDLTGRCGRSMAVVLSLLLRLPLFFGMLALMKKENVFLKHFPVAGEMLVAIWALYCAARFGGR